MLAIIFVLGIFYVGIFIGFFVAILIFKIIANSARGMTDNSDVAKKAARVSLVITTVIVIIIGVLMISDEEFREEMRWENLGEDTEVYVPEERNIPDTNERERDRREPDRQRDDNDSNRQRDESARDDRRPEQQTATYDYLIEAPGADENEIKTVSLQWEYRDTDGYNQNYTIGIELLLENIQASQQYIDRLNRLSDQWGNELFREVGVDFESDTEDVYVAIVKAIYENDKSRLNDIIAGFEDIFEMTGMDDMQQLYFVVTLIQNITYEMPGGGTDIFPPTVTLSKLYGDCDTMAILAYVILDGLGFDVVFMASEEYAHAMIGVNATATGEYLVYEGVRYYFCELTYPDWWLGELDSSCDNPRYWYCLKLS